MSTMFICAGGAFVVTRLKYAKSVGRCQGVVPLRPIPFCFVAATTRVSRDMIQGILLGGMVSVAPGTNSHFDPFKEDVQDIL